MAVPDEVDWINPIRIYYDLCSHLFLKIVDFDDNRLYWINGDGDMKSSKDDGSDVKTIMSTTFKGNHYAIRVLDGYIYYSVGQQLLMVNKTSGSTPIVLYNDTDWIYSILVFNPSGMLITISYNVNLHHKLT